MHCKGTIYENDFIFWMPGAGATHEGCASAYKWPAKPKQEQAAP